MPLIHNNKQHGRYPRDVTVVLIHIWVVNIAIELDYGSMNVKEIMPGTGNVASYWSE